VKRIYLKQSWMPPRLSLSTPALWWLILERFSAPGWVYGAIFFAIGLLYVVEFVRLVTGDAVDPVVNTTGDSQ
jgi:hypothetical protein